MSIFKLPDLGEGLPDAEISAWHVKVGDEVKVDEPLVAMETAKAIVEVPSPQAGTIVHLHGNPGDVIKTGASLVEFLSDAPAIADTGTVAGKIEVGNTILVENAVGIAVNNAANNNIKVTPAIRALAKQMGVDIALVTPTGPNNTVTAQDLQKSSQAQDNISGSDPSFIPLTGARKSMAQAMLQSHREVAPATVMDDAILLNWSDTEDISVRIIQAIVAGIKQEPALNAWFNGAGRKLIDTLDLGIACDTADGLFVPVIKNVVALSASAIRTELDAIKQSVQARSIPSAKLRGASFTLSNFGKFAGRYASPVVVPPQVAILGAGAIRQEVVAVNGEPRVSKVLPLSLTFDHRACTGGEATRFLAAVIQSLSS